MNKYLLYAILVIIIPCCILFASCSSSSDNQVYITSIEKSSSSGLDDIYTITYSDGSVDYFTISNGQDGQDGQDVSINEIYELYKSIYGQDLSFADFLDKYLDYKYTDNTVAINESLQSCLKVYTEYKTSTSYGWPMTNVVKGITVESGSAIIYAMDEDYTYVVTNYHVVYNENANADNGGHFAYKIMGYLYGSESEPEQQDTTDTSGYPIYEYGDYAIQFELVGASASTDLAVIKAKTSDILKINGNAKAVTLADNYYVGETAIAIGNTEGEGISVSQGVVSVDNEYISLSVDGTTRLHRSMRIDTAVYNGNSGGGLFNSSGDLIGIVNAGDKTDQNINYAIPLDIVTNVVDSIIYYDRDGVDSTNGVYTLSFGITVDTTNSKYVYDSETGYGEIVETISINTVNDNSIASQMGLQAGDVIVSLVINGEVKNINQSFEITDYTYTFRQGDNISFIVLRDGEQIEMQGYIVNASDLQNVE